MTMAVESAVRPVQTVRDPDRRRRWLRWRLAVLVTLAAAAVLLVSDANRRQRRQIEL
jgi:hypothetical protein